MSVVSRSTTITEPSGLTVEPPASTVLLLLLAPMTVRAVARRDTLLTGSSKRSVSVRASMSRPKLTSRGAVTSKVKRCALRFAFADVVGLSVLPAMSVRNAAESITKHVLLLTHSSRSVFTASRSVLLSWIVISGPSLAVSTVPPVSL